jgi:deazaflavin-dependent oxidoreductase (nitroreductase family)
MLALQLEKKNLTFFTLDANIKLVNKTLGFLDDRVFLDLKGNDMAQDFNDWNKKVIAEFRANGGKVGEAGNIPLLLLNTTGAKSGQPRINPLAYYNENGRIFIFASKAGAPTNPDWYHNIVAHPDVTVEVGAETFPATAVIVEGEQRDQIYEKQAALASNFAEYQEKTTRKIPVVELVKK